jgi:hypothetical protein
MANGSGARPSSRGVFISYRRGETSGQARALHDRLAQRFGTDRVFMDVDSIDPGADFVQKIEEAIGSSGVALVLIGHDWLSRRTDEHLLDDPTDFVRLETDTALRSGVPVIPILVERAPMPEPEELPESLRPLTRRNALELENQRWEYDVSRLVRAVEHLIDPEEEKDKEKESSKTSDEDRDKNKSPRDGRRSVLSTRNVIGAVGVVAVAVVLIVVFALPKPPHPAPVPKPHLVSATSSVAEVHSERLAVTLLNDGLSAAEVPSNISASTPQLQTYRTAGLVASINNGLTGPGPDLYILYEVFDNQPDASHYYSVSNALASSFTGTGIFRISGISDPTKCESGHSSASSQWDWSCLTLSSTVVSFIVVTSFSDTASTGVDLSATLTRDALKHLAKAAAATSHLPAPAPPGTRSPERLFRLLLAGPPSGALLPFDMSTPTVRKFSAVGAPAGLLEGSFVSNTFPTKDSTYLLFFVFASRQAARSWFNTDLRPSGSTVGASIDSSGFSQTTHCGTYSKKIASTLDAIAACYVAWGDVIAVSESWRSPTATTPLVDSENLAVALARTAVSDLTSLDAP